MRFSSDDLEKLVLECVRRYGMDCLVCGDSDSREYYSGMLQGLFGCVMVLSDCWELDSMTLSDLIDKIFPYGGKKSE